MKKDFDISLDEFELIEAYLEGSLSEMMTEAFEEKERSDSEWSQKIDEVKFLREGIAQHILREELHSIHEELFPKSRNKSSGRSLWIWAAAASIALLMVIGISYFGVFTSPHEKLFQAYYETDPGLIAVMSESENYEFDRGMVDFKSKDFESALLFWDPLLKMEPSNDTLQYFVAVANIEISRYDKSEKLLNELIAADESEFLTEARWNLALLYLKKGDIPAAKNILLTINTKEAANLLKELE